MVRIQTTSYIIIMMMAGLDLLTRDPGRYWTYFPKLSLIAP
jgi:hypothetical protein